MLWICPRTTRAPGCRPREKKLPLLDFFRRKPPIRDAAGLSDFIDENAAFLMQKGIYEYSRARAGHYAKVLFGESGFRSAVEESRWRAYPLGLALVAEMTDTVLRPVVGVMTSTAALREIALSVFDRYQVPAAIGSETWTALRTELVERLDRIGLHPPKRVIDIPEPFAEIYFACMPIHEKLRGSDFPTIKSYLKVTLSNIHDELTKRMDVGAVAAALTPTEVPVA
jgi:hypothetical protein